MPVFSRTFRGLFAVAALSLAAVTAHAQSFPTKPVRILVPYAAGGAVDVLARTLGQSLSKIWSQQPVIENRPGAGGIIASARTLGQTMVAALVALVFGLFDFSGGGAADAARAAIWVGAGFAALALVIGSLRLRH